MSFPGGQYVNHDTSPPHSLDPLPNELSSSTGVPTLSPASPHLPAAADLSTGPVVPNATAAACIVPYISATATFSDARHIHVDASNSVFNTPGRDLIINNYPSPRRMSFPI